MAIEQDLEIEPITSKKQINRTRRIVILTPRDSSKYEIVGTREQFVLVNGTRVEEENIDKATVRRMFMDVMQETVTVGNKTFSVGEIGVAIQKLLDRWAAEDLAAEQARLEAEAAAAAAIENEFQVASGNGPQPPPWEP